MMKLKEALEQFRAFTGLPLEFDPRQQSSAKPVSWRYGDMGGDHVLVKTVYAYGSSKPFKAVELVLSQKGGAMKRMLRLYQHRGEQKWEALLITKDGRDLKKPERINVDDFRDCLARVIGSPDDPA